MACVANPAFAREGKSEPAPAPLTGTWTCIAHGRPEGDVPFLLHLQQTGDTVTGSISSAQGSTELSLVKRNKGKLELHIDSPSGLYLLTGKFKKGQLIGQGTFQSSKGAFECKEQPAGGGGEALAPASVP